MFYAIAIILLIAFIVLVVKKWGKYNGEFLKKREEFIAYLEEIEDLKSLQAIGAINWFGQREDVQPKYSQLVKYLEEKIDETGDEKFENFLEAYRVHVSNFSILGLSFFISIIFVIHFIRKLFVLYS